MINIGVEQDKGLVYEGSGKYGRAAWPTPMVNEWWGQIATPLSIEASGGITPIQNRIIAYDGYIKEGELHDCKI